MVRIVTILLVVPLVLTRSQHKELVVQVAKAVARQLNTNCFTLLTPEPASDWLKLMSQTSYLSAVLQSTLAAYGNMSQKDIQWRRCGKLLHVLNGLDWSTSQEFSYLSSTIDLGKQHIWLLFLNNDSTKITKYLKTTVLPFDVHLITANVFSNDLITFHEPYRVSPAHPLRVPAIGTWTSGLGLQIIQGSVVSRRYNLEGLQFKVGSLENPPITTVSKDYITGQVLIDGFFGRIWKELELKMNFTSEYHVSVDNGTGTLEHGRWTGLVGMLVRNEIDVAVAEFSPTTARHDVIDFSIPLFSTDLQIFFKPSGDRIEWDSIVKPFRREIWFVILAWIIVAAVLLSGLYKICCFLNLEKRSYISEYTGFNSFITVLRAMTSQGNNLVPESVPCRLVVITTYLMAGVLLPSYSAALISFLAVHIPSVPFDSLDTMLKDGTYGLQAARKTAEYAYFADSREKQLKEVFEKLMSRFPADKMPAHTKQGIENVCNLERIAYYGPLDTGLVFAKQLTLEKGCKIMTLEKPLSKVQIAIAFTKQTPYKQAIDFQIQKFFDDGIIKRLEKMSWPVRETKVTAFTAIEISQVIQIHGILLTGLILSVVLLIYETLKRTVLHENQYPEPENHLKTRF